MEGCDDGVNAGSGCEADGTITPGYTCTEDTMWDCTNVVLGTSTCTYQCGVNGWQAAFTEQCDDGNASPGDGCDGSCQIETGYECLPATLHNTSR